MSIAVSGSIAYDHIMRFDDHFTNHFLKDNLDHLSVGFVLSDKNTYPGGTAQNIAYSLGLLGLKDTTTMLGAVGKDFVPDAQLQKYITYENIATYNTLDTAAAYVISDKNNNQITPFYPGALSKAGEQSLLDIPQKPTYSIVAPNEKTAMLRHLQESADNNIESFFVPGQMTSFWTKEDLLEGIKYADYLVCNEYEFDLICTKTTLSDTDIVKMCKKVIITLGAEGTLVRSHTTDTHTHAATVAHVVDPTGAGDSFIATVVGALSRGKDRDTAIKIGNIMASFVVEKNGTMQHKPSIADIQNRFQETYEETLQW